MSFFLIATGLALAGAPAMPEVRIAYTRDVARVTLAPPPGEHIQPDSPVSGWLEPRAGTRWQVATDGRGLSEGLLVAVSGEDRRLASALRVSLCTDVGNACRMVDLGFDVAIPGRKGDLSLTPYVPKPEERARPVPKYGVTADAALAQAKREGKRVLIDFGAVWCPPCNLLAAQVLEDPTNAADLAGFVVVGIDSDAPESWALKDRYAVGGYPTLVVVDPEGNELDRRVGYEDEGEFLAWLAGIGKEPSLGALPQPEAVDERTALRIARRLLEAGRDDEVQRWLDRLGPASAPALQDDPELRLLRFLNGPSSPEATWLIAKGVAPSEWLYQTLELTRDDPALRAAARAALEGALAHAPPLVAADLLDGLARLSEQEGGKDGRALTLAATRLLEGAVDADPSLGRAYDGYVADLYARGGALDQAARVLREAMSAWPGEFTWPYALAELLLDAGKSAEALEYALAAQSASYGDNRLRAVRLVARVLHSLGRSREALTVIDEATTNAPKPSADMDVRTHRYLSQLAETRAEIAAALTP